MDRGDAIVFSSDDGNTLPFQNLKGVDSLSLRVFNALFKTMRLHGQVLFRMLKQKGLYPGQARCLMILRHDDGIPQHDLARRLHVSRPTVTVMLQRMEQAGLIVRRSDESDQRITRVYVTDEGRAFQSKIDDVLRQFIGSGIGRMPKEDQVELERLLRSLGENLSVKSRGDGNP
ncbi:MAG: MarR family transcriptional regulator [Firmicutes bacterium]|nr:MarR family transcriptional regulator [Bacillota bacterium]